MIVPTRPTTSLPAFLRDAAWLAGRTPDALAIWGGRRLDPKLCEEVMYAVARPTPAAGAREPDPELAALEDQRPDEFDRRTWAAIAWAQACTRADVSTELETELARHDDEQQRADIELVTRVMTAANRAANTFDALLARLRGHPVADSRFVDEASVGVGMRCRSHRSRHISRFGDAHRAGQSPSCAAPGSGRRPSRSGHGRHRS